MGDRLNPKLRSSLYLVFKPLGLAIQKEVSASLSADRQTRVLDIGCGDKPYKVLFGNKRCQYIGLDLSEKQPCDVIALGEYLPFGDAIFDFVLSFQAMEHIIGPVQVLEEIHRVLAPGGHCLVSTHGTFVFHPAPGDYWRWTHQGLERLFQGVGFDSIKIVPQGGTSSCICLLLALYFSFLSDRIKWLMPLKWIGIPLLNILGPVLDKLFQFLNHPNPFNLTVNYLVHAQKANKERNEN